MRLAKVRRHLQEMLSGGRRDDRSDWEVYWKINMKRLACTSAWAFEEPHCDQGEQASGPRDGPHMDSSLRGESKAAVEVESRTWSLVSSRLFLAAPLL